MRVIAVIHVAMNITNLRAIIKSLKASHTDQFVLPDGFSANLRDRLKKTGLLENEQSSRFMCSDALVAPLIQEAILNKEYNIVVPLRELIPANDYHELAIDTVELSRFEKMHLIDGVFGNDRLQKRKLTQQVKSWLKKPSYIKYGAAHLYVTELVMANFNLEAFLALPFETKTQAIESCIEASFLMEKNQLKNTSRALQQWVKKSQILQDKNPSPAIANALIQWEWQYGSFGVSEALLDCSLSADFWREAPHFPASLMDHWRGRLLNAWHAHIRGEHTYAVNEYERAQADFKHDYALSTNNTMPFVGLPAVGHYLSLFALAQDDAEKLDQLRKLCKASTIPMEEVASGLFSVTFNNLPKNEHKLRLCGWFFVLIGIQSLFEAPQKKMDEYDLRLLFLIHGQLEKQPLLAQWLTCIAPLWDGDPIEVENVECLVRSWLKAIDETPAWLNSQIHSLTTATLSQDHPQQLKKVDKLSLEKDLYPSLVTLVKPKPAWQKALNDLKALTQPAEEVIEEENLDQNSRIIWNLSKKEELYFFTPREQKRLKQGGWGKGRVISLYRLANNDFDLPLSPHDRKICDCIEETPDYWREDYELDHGQALIAAAGHPYIFWSTPPEGSDPNRPIDIAKKDVVLEVHEQENHFLLQLSYDIPFHIEYTGFIARQAHSHQIHLVNVTPQHADIARVLGAEGLSIPKDAKEQVLDSINSIAPLITIESDLGSHNSNALNVPCDQRLHIQVMPQANGDLNFRIGVKPLGDHGQMLVAGEGRRHVTGDVKGVTHTTERNLALELEHLHTLQHCCSDLSDVEVQHENSFLIQSEDKLGFKINDNEWCLPEENALATLLSLQELQQKQPSDYELFWPQGKKFKVNQPADLSRMQINVAARQDWFSLEGELQLDEERVVSMNQLMALLQHHSGQFIPLGDNEFLTLTDQLRQRLNALAAQGDKQQYHPLALNYLEGITEGMNLQGDGLWAEQKNNIQRAYQSTPTLPKTLEASLRDYQLEGFEWMSRLSQWGGGACLADDMGLGKTLQCLTLILSRAQQGPTLVVAPTSVCMNWIREAARFTPTLNAAYLGDSEREVTVKNAGALDMIVCSYGLLTHEAELLQSIIWNTVVVDEAQALKNPTAKRSQILFNLEADCKIAATGTPIENHLGELWSLFRFINPGLLGSREHFNQRFAAPIEQYKDDGARDALRRLVQPFILRRLKNDVLTELPSRTEITRKITPSEEEQVFYEALRRQALNNLSYSSEHAGKKRMQALAEIMRLRRACCNPKLVLPSSTVASSKLEAFAEIFQELKENNHRVLVFSQFVDHLAIIKDYLENQKITFQYLDGSTPIKKRNQAVKAFQQGEGDAFLISLKAGGSGLNLTAADYVIHMDPWWNPAVEDQASDRAHRMGQTRPVTIYRLVTEGTIEEKILDLHQQKRDLADSLLEGSDMGGALSADQIIGLIETEA